MATITTSEASAWCVRFRRPEPGTMRLICFPHAGAGAAVFHPLSRCMPSQVEVVGIVPPGREARLREPPLTSIAAMAEGAADALTALPALPCAFFGHSMGAIIAFEVARLLRRRGLSLPHRLFLSGRRALNQPIAEPPLSSLDDGALVAEMSRRYGGIPATILSDPELLQLFLPIMRADMRAIEGYRDMLQPPLGVPVTLMGGMDDPQCTDTAWAGWHELVAVPVEQLRFPGGHFYLAKDCAAVGAAIAARLRL